MQKKRGLAALPPPCFCVFPRHTAPDLSSFLSRLFSLRLPFLVRPSGRSLRFSAARSFAGKKLIYYYLGFVSPRVASLYCCSASPLFCFGGASPLRFARGSSHRSIILRLPGVPLLFSFVLFPRSVSRFSAVRSSLLS